MKPLAQRFADLDGAVWMCARKNTNIYFIHRSMVDSVEERLYANIVRDGLAILALNKKNKKTRKKSL